MAPARPAVLDAEIDGLLGELEVPAAFPAEVLADSDRAARAPALPERDLTDLPFVTLDPPESLDLDQAMALERRGDGYAVRYAIADVAAFVAPGSPTDAEARARGQTLYAPGRRALLHPPVLSEAAASLLPGERRPAYVWTIELDGHGRSGAATVERAMVRSRSRHDYATVQRNHDAGAIDAPFELLPELGALLVERERERGGAALGVPDQEVERDGAGGYRLAFRPVLAVEQWNAQISLLTGMAAARLMLAAGVGILRTLPPPDDRTVARFRRQAEALGTPWADGVGLGDYLRSLDSADPRQLALQHESAALFRGAAYTPFDGAPPALAEQAAVGAPYAHVTAPLRRLVDRFGLAVCEAIGRDAEPPDWAREALATLPDLMRDSDRRAGVLERAVVDLAEATVLTGLVGDRFDAVVVDEPDRDGGPLAVQLAEPAVLAPCDGDAALGARVRVRLTVADPAKRTVRFAIE